MVVRRNVSVDGMGLSAACDRVPLSVPEECLEPWDSRRYHLTASSSEILMAECSEGDISASTICYWPTLVNCWPAPAADAVIARRD